MRPSITVFIEQAARFKLARRARDIASKYLDKRESQEHWTYKIRRTGGFSGIRKGQREGTTSPVRWIVEFRLNNEIGPIVGWLRLD